MAVINDFSEDYFDPNSDCYTEEIALGWRLPLNQDSDETTLEDFTNGITGYQSGGAVPVAHYKSANTDFLLWARQKIVLSTCSPI